MISKNWPAPAKINLFLHINGRRADGYHELQTAFQFIDLCDYLSFEITDKVVHLTTEFVGVQEQDNLIYRAAMLLKTSAGVSQGANISIEKRLPMGGGIGGGSSDAATTLVALNHLWNVGYSNEKLAQLGLALGADVPIFIHGFSALAEGVGEQLSPITPTESDMLLLHPNVHVSTAAVFTHPSLPRDTAKIDSQWLDFDGLGNDCQELVTQLYPQVAKGLTWLLKYAPAKMTGTGACLFAQFHSQQEAQKALSSMPDDFSGYVVKGINRSPLLDRLAQAQGSN